MEVISTLNEYEGSRWSLYSLGLLLTINHPRPQIQSTAELLTHKRQSVVAMRISSVLMWSGLKSWSVQAAGRILGERGSVNSAEFYYPDCDILLPAGPLPSPPFSLSPSLALSILPSSEVIHHGTVQIQCPTQVNYLAIIARSTTRSNIPQSITDLRDIHQLLTAATIKWGKQKDRDKRTSR